VARAAFLLAPLKLALRWHGGQEIEATARRPQLREAEVPPTAGQSISQDPPHPAGDEKSDMWVSAVGSPQLSQSGEPLEVVRACPHHTRWSVMSTVTVLLRAATGQTTATVVVVCALPSC
jgi:hypothetical protein